MTQFVYGKNVIKQILTDSDRAKTIWMAVEDREIEQLARKAHVAIRKTDRKQLTRLTGSDRHQGIAAEIVDYETYEVEDLLACVPEGKPGLLIMLDELEDPHNLGAVLRTADAVGAAGVIFKKNHNVGLTPTVAKVSAGAIETVKCACVTNLTRTLEDLKKKGWWAVAADMDGQDYRTMDYNFPTVLIIGNEGKGISRLLREKCDYVVSLPMTGRISSLNASVSAGILMYAVFSSQNPI
ncbi:MAG TPA: 23S rRNA (guanosine(2251)-2'-O)-methyltransferase RlmB [Erysipelotrichaceae bacterium]|nr:23S rRNA (guanosine(2251)-2'-O)-methyltransferase RlmB [Erysipelotrichaceae bacterium]